MFVVPGVAILTDGVTSRQRRSHLSRLRSPRYPRSAVAVASSPRIDAPAEDATVTTVVVATAGGSGRVAGSAEARPSEVVATGDAAAAAGAVAGICGRTGGRVDG